MISKLHKEIIDDIKQYFSTGDVSLVDPHVLDYTDEELCHMLFKDLRKRNGVYQGLRLTDFGRVIMSEIYQGYDFKMQIGNYSTNYIIINLHKHMTSPYYLNNNTLILYDGDLAVWMRLYNNSDFSKFLEMIKSKD